MEHRTNSKLEETDGSAAALQEVLIFLWDNSDLGVFETMLYNLFAFTVCSLLFCTFFLSSLIVGLI